MCNLTSMRGSRPVCNAGMPDCKQLLRHMACTASTSSTWCTVLTASFPEPQLGELVSLGAAGNLLLAPSQAVNAVQPCSTRGTRQEQGS